MPITLSLDDSQVDNTNVGRYTVYVKLESLGKAVSDSFDVIYVETTTWHTVTADTRTTTTKTQTLPDGFTTTTVPDGFTTTTGPVFFTTTTTYNGLNDGLKHADVFVNTVSKPNKTTFNVGEDYMTTGHKLPVDGYKYYIKVDAEYVSGRTGVFEGEYGYNELHYLSYPTGAYDSYPPLLIYANLDFSAVDKTKAGHYPVYLDITFTSRDAGGYHGVAFYIDYVDPVTSTSTTSTTTTTTATTTVTYIDTTTTTYDYSDFPEIVTKTAAITINKLPDKTVYEVGDELDLTGGTYSASAMVTYSNGDTPSSGLSNVSMTDNDKQFIVYYSWESEGGTPVADWGHVFKLKVDASSVDMSKAGVYPVSIIVYDLYDESIVYGTESFNITVKEKEAPTIVADEPSEKQTVAGRDVKLTFKTSDGKPVDAITQISSSDNSIAEVNNDGTVIFNKPGMVTISFKGTVDGQSAEGKINLNVGLMTGDVNGDGSVDGTDAGMVLREYAVLPEDRTFTEAQIKAGDINNDGSIDASDAGDILRYFAEKGAGYEGDDMAEWYKNLKF